MGFRFSVNFLLLYYKKKKLSFLFCFYESSRLQCKEKRGSFDLHHQDQGTKNWIFWLIYWRKIGFQAAWKRF